MFSASSERAESFATRSRRAAFLSFARKSRTASMPSPSTAAPAFALFHAVYAANRAPTAFHSSSVSTVLSLRAIDLRTSNCAVQTGLTGSFRSISALPVTRAKGYEAICSVLSARLSALMAEMSEVCTSRDAVLSGEKAASLERMKKSFTFTSNAL